jgi:hypothetical protein
VGCAVQQTEHTSPDKKKVDVSTLVTVRYRASIHGQKENKDSPSQEIEGMILTVGLQPVSVSTKT